MSKNKNRKEEELKKQSEEWRKKGLEVLSSGHKALAHNIKVIQKLKEQEKEE